MIETVTDTFFEEAYECDYPRLERILNAFGEPQSSDIIYVNHDVVISRFFTQTGFGRRKTYHIMFIAQQIDGEKYIVTCGDIKTGHPENVMENEKIGKRLLHDAMLKLWQTEF